MCGQDGTTESNRGVLESISPGRVASRHLKTVKEFIVEILIRDLGDETQLVWKQTFLTADSYEACKADVPRCDEENFDRLEREFAVMAPCELEAP